MESNGGAGDWHMMLKVVRPQRGCCGAARTRADIRTKMYPFAHEARYCGAQNAQMRSRSHCCFVYQLVLSFVLTKFLQLYCYWKMGQIRI